MFALAATPVTTIPSAAMLAMGNDAMYQGSMNHDGMNHAGMDHGSMQVCQAALRSGAWPTAIGAVNAVDPAKHTVNVTHEPIKALGWPTMTVDFVVDPSADLCVLSSGEQVNFTLVRARCPGATETRPWLQYSS